MLYLLDRRILMAAGVLAFFGIMFAAMFMLRRDPEPIGYDSLAELLETVEAEGAVPELAGQPAVWQGYPLPRPAWCVSPDMWVMATLPGPAYVVPACVSDGGTTYLGGWRRTDEGCEEPNGELGIHVERATALPAYDVYTICEVSDE